jgi:hypothetical protein
VGVDSQIDLSARNSSERSGRALTYEWRLRGPGSSAATLSETSGERSGFSIDGEGVYEVTLIVRTADGAEARDTARIVTGQRPQPPTYRDVLNQALPLAARDTFAYWFLHNYGTCVSINPARGTRTSWWRHGREEAHFVTTFRRPLGPDLERLRQLIAEGTQITRGVEDGIEFFSYNRRSMQQTVDSWASGFSESGTEGESAFGFQSEPEWQAFRQLIDRTGPVYRINRITIPYATHPRF